MPCMNYDFFLLALMVFHVFLFNTPWNKVLQNPEKKGINDHEVSF